MESSPGLQALRAAMLQLGPRYLEGSPDRFDQIAHDVKLVPLYKEHRELHGALRKAGKLHVHRSIQNSPPRGLLDAEHFSTNTVVSLILCPFYPSPFTSYLNGYDRGLVCASKHRGT